MASTKARSLTKAITWRALSTAMTASFVWAVTGRATFAAAVMAFDIVVMTCAYYLHERIWKGVTWGKYPTDWAKYGWRKEDDDSED